MVVLAIVKLETYSVAFSYPHVLWCMVLTNHALEPIVNLPWRSIILHVSCKILEAVGLSSELPTRLIVMSFINRLGSHDHSRSMAYGT